jgi:alpha-N-acetylgalactosaminidase
MFALAFGSSIFTTAIADGPYRDQKGSDAIFEPSIITSTSGPGPNGLAKTPPMGWMSWEIFRCQTNCATHPDSCIDHNLYEQMTDHLVEDGYLAAGYDQVSIDDCWEDHSGRDADGHLVPDASRFPDGMKALGDYMHGKGVRFGTYSDEGSKTCGGYPGTQGYEQDDAETFASWGVDYLKLDGCHNSKAGFVTGYPAAGAALQATGRNITYSCSWPAYLGSNEDQKPWQAMIDAGCNLWRNWGDIQCNWRSLSGIIDHWGDYGEVLQEWAGPGHWHDMDMLLIGNNCVTIDEQRTQMAIWAISASPLIMGNDLRSVPDDAKAILLNKDAISVSQDSLGRMGIRHPNYTSASGSQVWYRSLANGDVAVALYNKDGSATGPCDSWSQTEGGYIEACGGKSGNIKCFSGLSLEEAQDTCCNTNECAGFSFRDDNGSGCYKRDQDCGKVDDSKYVGFSKPGGSKSTNVSMTLDLTEVGFAADELVLVFDIWAQQTAGEFKGTFTANEIPLHGSAFLRLSSVSQAALV